MTPSAGAQGSPGSPHPLRLAAQTRGLPCVSAGDSCFPEGGPSCLSLLPSPLGLTAGAPQPHGTAQAQLPAAALPSPGVPQLCLPVVTRGREVRWVRGLSEHRSLEGGTPPGPPPEPPAGVPAPPVNSLQRLCMLLSCPRELRSKALHPHPGSPPHLWAAPPRCLLQFPPICLITIFLPLVAAKRVSYHL